MAQLVDCHERGNCKPVSGNQGASAGLESRFQHLPHPVATQQEFIVDICGLRKPLSQRTAPSRPCGKGGAYREPTWLRGWAHKNLISIEGKGSATGGQEERMHRAGVLGKPWWRWARAAWGLPGQNRHQFHRTAGWRKWWKSQLLGPEPAEKRWASQRSSCPLQADPTSSSEEESCWELEQSQKTHLQLSQRVPVTL